MIDIHNTQASHLPHTIAATIDATLLHPTASKAEIISLCKKAIQYAVKAVCIPPDFVADAYTLCKNTSVQVCTVIGFPCGYDTTQVKEYAAAQAIKFGADELDMVINIARLKSSDYKYVKNDIQRIVAAADNHIIKVILETCFLTHDEIITACKISEDAGADFVKTSTGFGSQGATVEVVSLMRTVINKNIGIKASGGIRTFSHWKNMINAGAQRIGTSSGFAIIDSVTSGNVNG